jgi:hypothetical protein
MQTQAEPLFNVPWQHPANQVYHDWSLDTGSSDIPTLTAMVRIRSSLVLYGYASPACCEGPIFDDWWNNAAETLHLIIPIWDHREPDNSRLSASHGQCLCRSRAAAVSQIFCVLAGSANQAMIGFTPRQPHSNQALSLQMLGCYLTASI